MSDAKFPRTAASAILWSQWAYWCALGIAVWAYFAMPSGSIRSFLVITPVAPGLLIFAVSYWLYLSCDEYVRHRTVRAAAITAIGIGLLSLVYFFLERLGFPKLSMMWIQVIGWSIFNVQMLYLWFEAK
jgi:hypothetical protein